MTGPLSQGKSIKKERKLIEVIATSRVFAMDRNRGLNKAKKLQLALNTCASVVFLAKSFENALMNYKIHVFRLNRG